MNTTWVFLPVAWGLATSVALAESRDATEKVHACLSLASAERLECLEKLSQDIAPPPAPPAAAIRPEVSPGGDNWIFSETTSPIDYSPIIIASALSADGPDGAALRLSIQCRGGRTDMVIDGPTFSRPGEEYGVYYAADGIKPTLVTAGRPASGTGVTIKVDVPRMLSLLPDRGDVVFHLTPRHGTAKEGRYPLAALKTVLKRLATPCNWPSTVRGGGN
jgi:hypothetical protein